MATSKRRKIETSESKPLSAFAARKKLQGNTSGGEVVSSETIKKQTGAAQDEGLFNGSLLAGRGDLTQSIRSQPATVSIGNDAQASATDTGFSDASDYDENDEIEVKTGAHAPAIGSVPTQFTSVNKLRMKRVADGTLRVKITAGERLVVLGQFGLVVTEGTISLMGAKLLTSTKVNRVFAFASHSLPVIRCLSSDCDEAEIELQQLESGMPKLSNLSPLFQNLGIDRNRDLLGDEIIVDHKHTQKPSSTFQVLFSASKSTTKALLWPVIAPSEWNEALAASTTGRFRTKAATRTLLSGPKSSGKSTFATLLVNRLLTESEHSKSITSSVAFLDLDPGQPEYSVPGQLSLHHIAEPNFGPPYTHPGESNRERKIIRAHSIGSITPSTDSILYHSAVKDLLAHYRSLLSSHPGCPLVVNTPGWVQGTGLELLVDLIRAAKPTEIIYMSTEGPWDAVTALKEAAGKTPFRTLPSQQKEYITRTAAHLRTMQTMSYLHMTDDKGPHVTWNSLPLSSTAPLEVRYDGSRQGIVGIMCLGEQPPSELLAETINGNIVAVAVIDDLSALSYQTTHDPAPSVHEIGVIGIDSSSAPASARARKSGRSAANIRINRTPENLPYLNFPHFASLPPAHSHSLGVALIRGIDVDRRRLQLLTPIKSSKIKEILESGKSIVLVSGKLDTPGWAYTEELNRRVGAEKRTRRRLANASATPDYGADSGDDIYVGPGANDGQDPHESAPWLEKLAGDHGRGAHNRVWRVRRDLGKSG